MYTFHMSLSAVIFDMDGVIVDSEPYHLEAEQLVLKCYGIEESSEELHARYLGTTAKFMYEDLIQRYGLDRDWQSLANEKSVLYLPLLRNKVELIDGVLNLIETLHAQGIQLALASSSRRVYVDTVLDKFNLRDYFGVSVSADDITHSKPDPEIFLTVSRHLGVPVERCWVIEDAVKGVEAAKRAGMSCLAFTPPGSIKKDFIKADATVSSMGDVLSFLEAARG